jgi:hypothetical protein
MVAASVVRLRTQRARGGLAYSTAAGRSSSPTRSWPRSSLASFVKLATHNGRRAVPD